MHLLLLDALRLTLVEALDAGLTGLLLHFSLERGVEVVLDVVVSAAREKLRDFRPSVAVLQVQVQNLLVFFFSPPVLLDVGVQMVVPSLAALLADASFEVVGNLTPVLCAMQVHLLDQKSILLLSPRALHHFGVEHFLPAVEALDIGAVLKSLGDALPVLGAHQSHEFSEFFVLKQDS